MAYMPRVQPAQAAPLPGNRPVPGQANVASVSTNQVEELNPRSAIGSSTNELRFQDYSRQEQAEDRRRRSPDIRVGPTVSRAPTTFAALIDAQEDYSTGLHSDMRRETAPFGFYLARGIGSYETAHRVATGTLNDRGNTLSLVY